MPSRLALVSLIVPDYDEAIAFFLRLGFTCRQDTDLGHGKRWVRIAFPQGETELLLAKASDDRQTAAIGNQGGGRVWLFLATDDFEADYRMIRAEGLPLESPPRDEAYGRVAVWSDPWGNRWDLIQFAPRT